MRSDERAPKNFRVSYRTSTAASWPSKRRPRSESHPTSLNFVKPNRLKVFAGIPSTSRGFASGVSRTVLVWQTAQLKKVRSTP